MHIRQCTEMLNHYRKALEQQYPEIGYYALDDADMFFAGKRSLVFNCEETESGKAILKQELIDETFQDR